MKPHIGFMIHGNDITDVAMLIAAGDMPKSSLNMYYMDRSANPITPLVKATIHMIRSPLLYVTFPDFSSMISST